MTEKQYPELPTHFMLVQESFRDEVYLYTADQMRAYVDADRAMRAAQAAPAAGARPSITPTERVTIHTLISLARLTYLALDDSEEFVDDDGRCHRISGQAFDDVEATLETLDELPDDKPGITLSPGGKAWWALRGLLNPVAQAAPQPVEHPWVASDTMRADLIADLHDVFDTSGSETPQIVRDVIEYANSWLQVCIQKKAESSAQQAAPASQDAEDAARYRGLRDLAKEQLLYPQRAASSLAADMRTHWELPVLICSGPIGGYRDFDSAVDSAIDAARAKQEGE